MRKADSPGSYRIKAQADGRWLLSGVSTTGKRIKIPGLSYKEAERTGLEIFGPSNDVSPDTQLKGTIAPIVSATVAALDDWGLPVGITSDKVQSVNASLGLSNPTVNKPGASVTVVSGDDEAGKRLKRAKQAKSIMELAGVSWAAGSVWVGRRVCQARELDPVNPNPRQVNDLAEVTKETLIEWFGDANIKPWQMLILLTLGIPLSMWIQSPKRKEARPEHLKSVP